MRTARTTVTHLLATALLLFGSGAARLHAQQEQELDTEQAFFLFMKIYDLNPYTPTFEHPGEIRNFGNNFLQYYVTVFDNATFTAKRNDEFERPKYLAAMQKKLSDGIAGARFDKKYIKWANATIGEYSFTTNSFPILFEPRYALLILWLERLEAQGVIVNFADFGFRSPNDTRGAMSLAMPEVEAKAFLAQRRAANGSVNRTISLKFTHSVLNKQGKPGNVWSKSFGLSGLGRDVLLFVHSIDIYGFQGGKKLGTIYPTKSFDEYTREISEVPRSQISTSNLNSENEHLADSSCHNESNVRSLEAVLKTTFAITNRTEFTLIVYWLDYQGTRKEWFRIAPNQNVKQETFKTHQWLVADPTGKCLRIFEAPAEIVIE